MAELNIKIFSTNIVIEKLPKVDYTRKCRGGMRIISVTLDVCRLAKNGNWLQIFFIVVAEDKPPLDLSV